jgi:hypothetical protein
MCRLCDVLATPTGLEIPEAQRQILGHDIHTLCRIANAMQSLPYGDKVAAHLERAITEAEHILALSEP